jgi:hypothetical protein
MALRLGRGERLGGRAARHLARGEHDRALREQDRRDRNTRKQSQDVSPHDGSILPSRAPLFRIGSLRTVICSWYAIAHSLPRATRRPLTSVNRRRDRGAERAILPRHCNRGE